MDQESTKAILPIPNQQDTPQEVIITEKYPMTKSNLGSLIRLVIGGVSLGYEELMIRLNNWDNLITYQQASTPGKDSDTSNIFNQKQVTVIDARTKDVEENDRLKFAVFGLLFEGKEKAARCVKEVDKSSRKFVHSTQPFIKPFTTNRFIKHVMNSYDRLAQRGQDEVNKWVNSGKVEYQHSHQLAKIAYQSTINEAINEMAEKPEIQNLIQTQSLSLASEVIEETRERSVTADNLIENLLRAAFRRPLRAELPPPPAEIQKKAINIQVTK